jgi:hypothetical protein
MPEKLPFRTSASQGLELTTGNYAHLWGLVPEANVLEVGATSLGIGRLTVGVEHEEPVTCRGITLTRGPFPVKPRLTAIPLGFVTIHGRLMRLAASLVLVGGNVTGMRRHVSRARRPVPIGCCHVSFDRSVESNAGLGSGPCEGRVAFVRGSLPIVCRALPLDRAAFPGRRDVTAGVRHIDGLEFL